MSEDKILVINSGSSSIKFQLFLDEKHDFQVISSGLAERINVDGNLKIKFNNKNFEYKVDLLNHDQAIKLIFTKLVELKIVSDLEEINLIGHRVVHGGDKFIEPTIVTENVIKEIENLAKIAPLHNIPAAITIRACIDNIKAKNVVVFDTSFHMSIPEKNYLYGIPYEWYQKYQIRRYGFHGINYQYVLEELKKCLNKPEERINAIVCHLGNGASITAIKNGKSFNTSMGFSPSEGLIMGTRAGDLDFMILKYLSDTLNLSLEDITDTLNKKSGLLGLSQISSDLRDIESVYEKNDNAKRAIAIFVKQIVKYIAWYLNELDNKIDALVFTGGIGENSHTIRKLVINNIKIHKFDLNHKLNESEFKDKVKLISTAYSDTPIYLIRANEELMIAKDTVEVIKNQKKRRN